MSVYAVGSLCGGAKRELAVAGEQAGKARVVVVCLPEVEAQGRVDLARTGANARRATEDSAAIAFLEPPAATNRFAQPIVESADLAYVKTASPASAMKTILHAVAEAGSNSPRPKVREAFE